MSDTIHTPLVPYDITICGLTELCQFNQSGVTHVLSILDPDWPDPEDFRQYGPHQRVLWRFHDIVNEQDGMLAPTENSVRDLLDLGEKLRGETVDHLLIHCHMGISRSTAAAITLMVQHNPGRERDAFTHLRRIRPRTWPNSRMIRFADDMLGRGGALVKAASDHYAEIAKGYPDLAKYLRTTERAPEVPAEGDL